MAMTPSRPARRAAEPRAGILVRVKMPALKEWAVVVHALLAGEQLLDVRKGGVREDDRRFALESRRFWLWPTFEHQRAELLKPAYRRWITERGESRDDATIRVEGWAEVVATATLTEPDDLATLDGKLIWTTEYAASRLRWKRREPLWVLALRVHRLVEPRCVAWRDDYAKCASWLEVADLPDDPIGVASEPALTDESFAARLELVRRELPGRFTELRGDDA